MFLNVSVLIWEYKFLYILDIYIYIYGVLESQYLSCFVHTPGNVRSELTKRSSATAVSGACTFEPRVHQLGI